MSDLPKRRYAGTGDRLHADMELAVRRVRDDLVASEVAYTPATPGDWVSPAPTTVAAALDRLAASGGTTPVPV